MLSAEICIYSLTSLSIHHQTHSIRWVELLHTFNNFIRWWIWGINSNASSLCLILSLTCLDYIFLKNILLHNIDWVFLASPAGCCIRPEVQKVTYHWHRAEPSLGKRQLWQHGHQIPRALPRHWEAASGGREAQQALQQPQQAARLQVRGSGQGQICASKLMEEAPQ